MKQTAMLAAGVAAAALGVVVVTRARAASATPASGQGAAAQDPLYAAGPSYASMLQADTWRTQGSGVPYWYKADASQTQLTQAQIDKNWSDLQAGVFKSDPLFWA